MRSPNCVKCGAIKEGPYVKDSYCKICRSEKGKEARAKARLAKGKEKRSESGKSPNCYKCKKPKEVGRENESWCKSCKSESMKLARARKRAELGLEPLRPMGSGPNPVCRCGIIKERPLARECNACHRKRDNDWRLKTGRTKKHRTGLCACGQPFASYSNCYCTACATKWKTRYLANNPEQKEKAYANNRERKNQSFDEFVKYQTRYTTGNAIRNGMLIKQPCEVCGTTENIEAHHDDYTKPYDIRWLCRKHHNEHHHPLDKTEN